MRIVWTCVAFVAGAVVALTLGFSPGHKIPVFTFFSLLAAVLLITTALGLSRRRAAYALLCLVFLLGCWRGGDAINVQPRLAGDSNLLRAAPTLALINTRQPLDRMRTNLEERLKTPLRESEFGLPLALLTGNRSYLDAKTTNDFRASGLAHLLAISGLHVSLVGGFAMALSNLLFGKRHGLYLLMPVFLVLLYASLAGFAPPITRAAIMFCVFVLGRLLGRGSHTLAALSLAGMLMVAWEPELISNLSFQLSFAAMLGISFVVPILDEYAEVARVDRTQNRRLSALSRLRRFVAGSLAVSIAASIATFPLVAWHFQAVPLWGPIATLVTIPAMPVLIFSSAVAAAVGTLPVISAIAVIPVQAATGYLTASADFFAGMPPGPIKTGDWSVWILVVCYLAIASIIVGWVQARSVVSKYLRAAALNRSVPPPPVSKNVTSTFALPVVLLLVGTAAWSAWLFRTDTERFLTVTFLPTSHGESIFIRTPNDNRILVDGGSAEFEVSDTLRFLLPAWDRELDMVILTHPDADHVGGLPAVLNQFLVGTVLHSGVRASSDAFESWSNAIDSHRNVVVAHPGMTIGLDRGVFLEVISVGCLDGSTSCADTNEASIVAMLNQGDVSFLLTGDIERSTESRLVNSNTDLRSTVFKAPHHGSATSSTQAFIDAVNPAAAVVAAGTKNRYGHPDPGVLNRLNTAVGEDRVFRTDRLGTVTFQTDGKRLWIVH